MPHAWKEDILGTEFEQLTIDQPNDYDGAVVCTLVRTIMPIENCSHAALYLHGFSDYFFQREQALWFAARGIRFYALDLRKYGRSLREGQKMFRVHDLHEYFDDIDKAIAEILDNSIDEITLIGHSTGGLIASLYLSERRPSVVKHLILNSPFLAWNLPLVKKTAIPFIACIARIFPNLIIDQKATDAYARCLLKRFEGEWEYNLAWKPMPMPPVEASWIAAIDRAHRCLHRNRRSIKIPILLARSSASVAAKQSVAEHHTGDAVLNVNDIAREGILLGENVTEVVIANAMHDLSLSMPEARAAYYAAIARFLSI